MPFEREVVKKKKMYKFYHIKHYPLLKLYSVRFHNDPTFYVRAAIKLGR